MCFAAIESGDLVAAAERVTNLIRPDEGFTDFSANRLVDLRLKPNAPPAAAESLIKWRRVVVFIGG